MNQLITLTEAGLYCPMGDFYIDPRLPVDRAIITHAHGDHARSGSAYYLAAKPGEHILRSRLGSAANIETIAYREAVTINGVKLSLHPAGHILGSSQVRLEYRGEVWVASGDYKVAPDVTCEPIEPLQCHTFITESTFSLPIYCWPDDRLVYEEISKWWQQNQRSGKTSILLAYSLGKAQRILANLNPEQGPIYTHGAVEELNNAYRQSGVSLPSTILVAKAEKKNEWHQGIVIAPPAILDATWLKQFGKISVGFASGWMLVRGARRRRAIDRGFVLSDHADWPGLLSAINATNAQRILITHGAAANLVRYLQEQGKDAMELEM